MPLISKGLYCFCLSLTSAQVTSFDLKADKACQPTYIPNALATFFPTLLHISRSRVARDGEAAALRHCCLSRRSSSLSTISRMVSSSCRRCSIRLMLLRSSVCGAGDCMWCVAMEKRVCAIPRKARGGFRGKTGIILSAAAVSLQLSAALSMPCL